MSLLASVFNAFGITAPLSTVLEFGLVAFGIYGVVKFLESRKK